MTATGVDWPGVEHLDTNRYVRVCVNPRVLNGYIYTHTYVCQTGGITLNDFYCPKMFFFNFINISLIIKRPHKTYTLKHNSPWGSQHVNLIFLPDLAGDNI